MARVARLQASDRQAFHRAAYGFPKADLDLIFEVGAGLDVPLRFSHASAASEKLAEQIAEIGAAGSAEVEAAKVKMHVAAGFFRRRSASPLGVEAELVVHLAFLGVRQDVVGFLDLL